SGNNILPQSLTFVKVFLRFFEKSGYSGILLCSFQFTRPYNRVPPTLPLEQSNSRKKFMESPRNW
ncbi:hypothetical protein, partial [Bacteroides acidifaciens]|uniref:hypothetical protein n=1 Tax=Bacteroides acidifaciens TaxID=85831 RepID=UPI0025AA2B2C